MCECGAWPASNAEAGLRSLFTSGFRQSQLSRFKAEARTLRHCRMKGEVPFVECRADRSTKEDSLRCLRTRVGLSNWCACGLMDCPDR